MKSYKVLGCKYIHSNQQNKSKTMLCDSNLASLTNNLVPSTIHENVKVSVAYRYRKASKEYVVKKFQKYRNEDF